MAIKVRLAPLLLLIAVVVLLLWLPYFLYMLSPVSASTDTIRFSISKGEGLREISDDLETKGLIKSASILRLYSFFSGNAHKLKPGVYSLTAASSSQEIIAALVSGPETEITVLIKEGESINQIDAKLADFGVIKKDALLKYPFAGLPAKYPFLREAETLEGFLFPDTYRFFFDSKPEEVVKIFLDNFERKALPLLSAEEEYLRILTVASMIEAEVPDKDERRVVSGIIYKRLKLSMPLQIDATYAYAKTHGDVYDTYKFYGLPPGPINNPGLDAIDAALNPRASAFMYYLSDPATDKTIFSATFEEHVANRRKYLPDSLR